MEKRRKIRIFRSLIAVAILTMLMLPVGVAIAESLGTSSTVITDTTYVIGDTYQRHSFISEGLHWVFYSSDDAIYYTSSGDAETWDTPTKFDDYTCNVSPSSGCCNGSVFSLWYNVDDTVVDIAYMNVTGINENIYYARGNPSASGTITWNTSEIAVNASAELEYSHPSICDNSLDYPFISYMVYNGSSYFGNLSTSTTNDSTWSFATNSSLSSLLSLNISTDVLYPSVIPVTEGNVSLTVVFFNGSNYLLAQNYADYDIDTDTWDYPETVQFPLPATSYIDVDYLADHSEVAWSGNLTNPDDVYIVATANDSVLGEYYFYDRYGDPGSPFIDDTSLGTGIYVGSLAIRDALGDLTVTAMEETQKTDLYNADFTQATMSWDGLAVIAGIDGTSWTGTESDYDNAGTDYQGTLYYDNMVAFSPDLEYGCYGCTPTVIPATIPASVTAMAWVVVLVFGALICLVLLAFGASEAVKTGNTELAKIAGVGLITLVIVAIIVENLL